MDHVTGSENRHILPFAAWRRYRVILSPETERRELAGQSVFNLGNDLFPPLVHSPGAGGTNRRG